MRLLRECMSLLPSVHLLPGGVRLRDCYDGNGFAEEWEYI